MQEILKKHEFILQVTFIAAVAVVYSKATYWL